MHYRKLPETLKTTSPMPVLKEMGSFSFLFPDWRLCDRLFVFARAMTWRSAMFEQEIARYQPAPADSSLLSVEGRLPIPGMRLHVRPQDRIDVGLIAPLSSEPGQQIGIETHRDRLFWLRHNHSRRLPEGF